MGEIDIVRCMGVYHGTLYHFEPDIIDKPWGWRVRAYDQVLILCKALNKLIGDVVYIFIDLSK